MNVSLFVLLCVILCCNAQVRKPNYIEWVPANPLNYRVENDRRIEYLIIHDTQISFNETLTLFQTPNRTSCHYVVHNSDAPWGGGGYEPKKIVQMVSDKDVAYHVKGSNTNTIGIEHVENGTYSYMMYRSSAELAAHICSKHQIPLDREHIIAHSECKKINCTSDHVDPGVDWDWQMYMSLISAATDGNCPLPDLNKPEDNTIVITFLQYMFSINITNVLDSSTVRAINDFKIKSGLQAEPLINEEFWKALLGPFGYQTKIYKVGLNKEPLTIVSAVQYIQSNRFGRNVQITGVVDDNTLFALLAVNEMAGISEIGDEAEFYLDTEVWSVLLSGCLPKRDASLIWKVVLFSLTPAFSLLLFLFLISGIIACCCIYKTKKHRIGEIEELLVS
ncbi:N-acetylmuramoyl-L-alanine amidase A [Acrasis kona]|uniref:N-acetylmuramoyl-L-alanine amidase n=1 Tax=Acrasis kona TaxID=1008807 RepID=A0AAW2YZU7_9EUKA